MSQKQKKKKPALCEIGIPHTIRYRYTCDNKKEKKKKNEESFSTSNLLVNLLNKYPQDTVHHSCMYLSYSYHNGLPHQFR